ncbi:MAG: hypothetical protein JOY62_14830 [Acidobacteriaceae bacterium]|nr:hypothetical protein [Acidobacteriaceae bacterium]MBV9781236.1 hypothetical protein [Acidobacteriaceae bacterium]
MRNIVWVSALMTGFLTLAPTAAATSPFLASGSASGVAGTSITIPITFTASSIGVAALQCSIGVPSGWSIASVTTGQAATGAGKTVNANKSTGMLMVFGVNQQVIATGVVADVKINIPSSAASGTYSIPISGVVFSSPDGATVAGGVPVNGSIKVQGTNSPLPEISSFVATPSSITAGSSSTLSWAVTNATGLSISPNVGTVTGTSISVSPQTTTTYTLTATNSNGSSTAEVTVTVKPPAPTIHSFSASPSSIAAGSSSTLSWSVTGATSLSISPGIGKVTGTSVSVSPTATTTYTLTATNSGGSVTAHASVTVKSSSALPTISSFSANPSSITAGNSSTLSWSVTGATSLSISPGIGSVTGTSVSVSPTATTTYTLTATNSSGSVSATASVTVTGSSGPPIIYSFTANPSTIASGDSSTLSWDVTGATSMTLIPSIGAVTGSSITVSPTTTTQYRLLAENINGSTAAYTTITVTNGGSAVEPAVLDTSVSSLVFTATEGGPNPNAQSLLISNAGGATSNWKASNREHWLTLNPSMGGNGPTAATVSVNSQGMRAGTYLDTITVISRYKPEPPQTIPVELVISGSEPGTPSLELSSSNVVFVATQDTHSPSEGISISNSGAGVLHWSATHTATWLHLTPTSGVNGSMTRPTLMMWVDAQGLAPGNYFDSVTVTAPGAVKSPQSIDVWLTVR